MKCQLCQENDASIVFTQIVNNEKIVLQICSECARKKGISIDFEKPTQPQQEIEVPQSDIVFPDDDSTETPDIVCESCGLSFAEFKSSGLFGCDKCHIAFGAYVETLLRQIHGTCVYEGSSPGAVSEEGKALRDLKRLRQELRKCIESEDYERAARLRDQIADLEAKDVQT